MCTTSCLDGADGHSGQCRRAPPDPPSRPAGPTRAHGRQPGVPGHDPRHRRMKPWRPSLVTTVAEGGVDGTPVRPAPRLVGGRSIELRQARRGGRGDQATQRRWRRQGRGTFLRTRVPPERGGGLCRHGPPARPGVQRGRAPTTPRRESWCSPRTSPTSSPGAQRSSRSSSGSMRANCIDFSLTNMAPNWTGRNTFQELAQTNMAGGHVHLVKFDVTASDSSSNGWNYEQAAFTKDQAALTAKQAAGELECQAGAGFYGTESTGLSDRGPGGPGRPRRTLRACGVRRSTSGGTPTTNLRTASAHGRPLRRPRPGPPPTTAP